MIRKVIRIDEEKCDGCGLCAEACHEGAIGVMNGKAVLLRDDYCDGLGNCLPVCPRGAISFEEREAAGYDEAAVRENMAKKEAGITAHSGCPGSAAREIARETESAAAKGTPGASSLRQWPVQIKLAPVKAPYFGGANLLISADCAAYAHGDFHGTFMNGRATLIGCPKLDGVDYSEKLSEILTVNNIESVMVVRMEVPCCGGIEKAAADALKRSGKSIPFQVVTLSVSGEVIDK